MQANNQEAYTQIHNSIQKTVDKMYSKIDSIIESAISFVESNPEKGEYIVRHVAQYTKEMHQVIDNMIQEYSAFISVHNNIAQLKGILSGLIAQASQLTAAIESALLS